ncbi:sigma-54 dependent transcriptional regulator [Vibrio sp. SS-MA-C1-2]|uniref:sigma-54 dependent transcriptional regulator n=1 Tax=Vibrio sp. SS-MA-C1-2 TaxID=2908646 RepID=UPI001F21C8B5|nr:sigma-54 dependent transcriptional regulator [Vibrio sp. SS-MA-C1-2]UJF19676.1 sigma-54 dependent transcriptional regulator [Vibrio sp. SS-MA-C1-2]
MNVKKTGSRYTRPLIIVGGVYEPWLTLLDQTGWSYHRCYDLRAAQAFFNEVGSCIGIMDMSHDDFSIDGMAKLAHGHRQVRWLALIRQEQLKSDAVCQFIVNFCVDYFVHPVADSLLLSSIGHQLAMLELKCKIWPQIDVHHDLGILGNSVVIRKVKDQIRRVAPTDVSVLILGESGTGKELVARAIHKNSVRNKAPFITLNCRQRSFKHSYQLESNETLDQAIKLANNGSLFIDEIADLTYSQQAHLLQILQDRSIDHHHQQKEPIDIRIIAATHFDLAKLTVEKRFREDLYYRLNVLRIKVPTLRERNSDIMLLAEHYLFKFSQQYNTQARYFTEDAKQKLMIHLWPGNVRELVNQIKQAVLLADGNMIESWHLDLPSQPEARLSLRDIREDTERNALISVLESHDGQVSAAAKELGVSRATMYRLLNKHQLITESNDVFKKVSI